VSRDFCEQGQTETVSGDRLLCALPFSLLRDIQLPAHFPENKRKAINEVRYDTFRAFIFRRKSVPGKKVA
jgi:monoamine oxidase